MISELSPRSSRALLSWYTGWTSILGWVAFTASAPFGAANIVQGLIILNYPDYEPKTWHWYLIYLATAAMAFFMNIWGGKVLPMLENIIMVFHVGFFIAILIAVAALPRERQSAEFVFTHFSNGTGWDSNVIAWSIGMLTSAYVMVGK
jgi:amino acid transporter